MRQRSIGCDTELEAGKLRAAQVERDHAGRLPRQERQRVVSGRRDRHADVAGADIEAGEQDVGVFPGLGVADIAEVGARC